MDTKIVERIKNKDSKGLDLLINIYSKNIHYIVKTILAGCGTKEDVEECISDIVLSIWKDIYKFEEKRGSFKTFILIKSKYIALDYKRKLERKNEKVEKTPLEELVLPEKSNIEEEMGKKERFKEIINIIKSFKEPDKTYFYLKYFMDYDIKSIASKFEDSVSGVENRLYRCRLKLKNILGEE